MQHLLIVSQKIDRTTKDDAEDLDLLMYNLTEYSSKCYSTTGKLWFSSKDEAIHFNDDNVNKDNFKSSKYEPKLSGYKIADGVNEI